MIADVQMVSIEDIVRRHDKEMMTYVNYLLLTLVLCLIAGLVLLFVLPY